MCSAMLKWPRLNFLYRGLFQENTERMLSSVQEMMDRLRTQINADSAQVSQCAELNSKLSLFLMILAQLISNKSIISLFE